VAQRNDEEDAPEMWDALEEGEPEDERLRVAVDVAMIGL
jgi:hypothetical protein